jgi:hypothetical protein
MPDLSVPFSNGRAGAPVEPPSPAPSAAVAERLMAEGLLSLVQAAALLPPVRGKRVATSSIFRWIVRGKHGVRLEGIRLHGGGWWTSKAALARFAAAVTASEA